LNGFTPAASRVGTRWRTCQKRCAKNLLQDFHFNTELIRSRVTRRTQKFLWKMGDNQLIESVLIPASPALYGDASDRHTLCISTQVGCAYGCNSAPAASMAGNATSRQMKSSNKCLQLSAFCPPRSRPRPRKKKRLRERGRRRG